MIYEPLESGAAKTWPWNKTIPTSTARRLAKEIIFDLFLTGIFTPKYYRTILLTNSV
jgi:hypothetical protein